MRLKEELKKSGYFWLPLAEERKIPGVITITDGGNIDLEIVGIFEEIIQELNLVVNEKNEYQRIIGNIEQYGFVTLENCFYKFKNVSLGGIAKSFLFVNKAFIGFNYSIGSISRGNRKKKESKGDEIQ